MQDVLRYVPWSVLVLGAACWVALRRVAKRKALRAQALAGLPRTYDEARRLFLDATDGTSTAVSGATPRDRGGAAIEITGPGGSDLLLALADGTVGLYVRGGPSVLGLGEIASVRAAATRFLRAVAESEAHFRPVTNADPPEPGWVVFRTRTSAGPLAATTPAGPSAGEPAGLGELLRLGAALRDEIERELL